MTKIVSISHQRHDSINLRNLKKLEFKVLYFGQCILRENIRHLWDLQIIKLFNNEMKITMNRICDVVLLLIVASVMTSCRPRGLLSPNEMEDLFVELHRAEGIIYVKGYKNGHDSVVRLTYDSILKSHGVTRAQFDSSLVWYTDNPMVFDKIYPHVIDRLTALQEQERKRNEEEIHREQEELHKDAVPPSPDTNRLLQNGQ